MRNSLSSIFDMLFSLEIDLYLKGTEGSSNCFFKRGSGEVKTIVLKICGKIPEDNERLANFQVISKKTIEQDFKGNVGVKSTQDDKEFKAEIIFRT